MNKIPNFFHFVFGLKPQTEPFHLVHYLCLASCLAVNRPEKIFFHYKHMPYGKWWDLIKPHLVLNEVDDMNFISSFNYTDRRIAQYKYAHVSDIIRLEVLFRYGGIYADMDTLFVSPLPGHFFEKDFIMGKERIDLTQEAARIAGGSLCNAWIASAPEAEFGRIWLKSIESEFDGTWSAHSTFLPYKLSQRYKALIHIEPERSFFYFDWTRQGIQDIFVNNIEKPSQIYSIHLWSHLWWSAKRIDFTFFHEGKLTPDYIMFANTTFSHLARKFLPENVPVDYSRFRRTEKYKFMSKIYLYMKSKIG